MNRFFVRRPQPKPADSNQSENAPARDGVKDSAQSSPQPTAQINPAGNSVSKTASKPVNGEPKANGQYALKTADDTPRGLTLSETTAAGNLALSEAKLNGAAATAVIPNGNAPKPLAPQPNAPQPNEQRPDGSVQDAPKLGAPNLVMPNTNRQKIDNSQALISINNVVKAYQTPVGEFIALRGITLAIGRGEFVAVVGKSGSGKSTLINMITGIDRPTSGEIFVDKTPIHNLAEGPMAEWRGRNVGIIFQFFQLLPMLSCIENVMLPMDFCNMFKPSEREGRALHLLEQVDMVEHAYKLPSEVSGGQQQRVAIARALANDPPLLVADEPTGNLDSRTADAVFQLFAHMVDAGKTILMVTHDDEMAHQVRRTITLTDGQIVNQEYHAQHLQPSPDAAQDDEAGENQDAAADPTGDPTADPAAINA